MFYFDTCKQTSIFALGIIFDCEDSCFSDKNEILTCLLDVPEAILAPTNFGWTTEQKKKYLIIQGVQSSSQERALQMLVVHFVVVYEAWHGSAETEWGEVLVKSAVLLRINICTVWR